MSAGSVDGGGLEEDWDALRLALLIEVASVDAPGGSAARRRAFEVALTDAFDRPAPAYPAYRRLRTFARVRWPVLRAVLEGAGRAGDAGDGSVDDPVDGRLDALLDETTEALAAAARARGRHGADALEREMALLRRLLGDDADLDVP